VRIKVDIDRCVAAGQCVLVAGDYFDQGDDDGLVLLKRDTVAEGDAAAVEDAVFQCPARAIETVG
jgi:ferredoxin